MKFPTLLTLLLSMTVASTACAKEGSMKPAMDKNMAHAHMGHVLTGWKDTPGGTGLITALEEEAGIAAQHAGFAAQQPGNLGWMKTHTHHVRHAIDASTENGGPGKGYGAKKAAMGVAAHIGFAAGSDGASDNVKLHSVHVGTAARNVVGWCDEIIALSNEVLAATSAAEAAPKVKQIQALTGRILNGFDADGNGNVTWQKGEGGLAQAKQHMGFMKKGEGMM